MWSRETWAGVLLMLGLVIMFGSFGLGLHLGSRRSESAPAVEAEPTPPPPVYFEEVEVVRHMYRFDDLERGVTCYFQRLSSSTGIACVPTLKIDPGAAGTVRQP